MTQKELVDKLDVARTTLANYEQGTRFPDKETLLLIADFSKLSILLSLYFSGLNGSSKINGVPEKLIYVTSIFLFSNTLTFIFLFFRSLIFLSFPSSQLKLTFHLLLFYALFIPPYFLVHNPH